MPRSPGRTGHAWRKAKAAAIARSTHCYLCGKPLTDMRYPHPLSTAIDHVLELSEGGPPLDPRNLRATHMRCNLRKEAQRRRKRPRRSRDW